MYFHLRTKCTKWLPSPYVIISMVVYLFIWEWHPPLRPWRWWAALAVIAARSAKTRAPDYRLCEDEIYNKERKWDLMESMIDGSFKWRGPALLFLLNSLATNSTPPPPPRFIMRIRARRLFNSSFERRVDRGEANGGGDSRGGIGRVSVLCRRGTSLAGQCQAAPWGDETGPPRWTNAL